MLTPAKVPEALREGESAGVVSLISQQEREVARTRSDMVSIADQHATRMQRERNEQQRRDEAAATAPHAQIMANLQLAAMVQRQRPQPRLQQQR